jgi:hypothetical protein
MQVCSRKRNLWAWALATACASLSLAPILGARADDAAGPTKAEIDAAFQEVQRDVLDAATQYSKDAASDTSLNDAAAAFIKDSQAIAAGASAAEAVVDLPNSVITTPELQQLSTELKAVSAYAGQLAAAQPATDDCETMARANDKLIDLLNFGVAANKSQDQVLDDIKKIVSQANGSTQAELIASSDIRALSQAHISEAEINGFLVQNTKDAERKAFLEKCSSLAGPVKGSMTAHFYTKQGAEWWTYSFRIHGAIRLHVARVAAYSPTVAVPVEGEIFGYGDAFTYKTDPYSAAYRKIVQGATIDDVAPVGNSAGVSYGGAAVSPVGFITLVVGTITGDRLDLRLGDAVKDFDQNYVLGSTTATVVSTLPDVPPQKNSYTLPYKNARWILDQFFSHGLTLQMQHRAQPQLDYAGFSAVRNRPANQNSADYTLSLRPCEPKCSAQ